MFFETEEINGNENKIAITILNEDNVVKGKLYFIDDILHRDSWINTE